MNNFFDIKIEGFDNLMKTLTTLPVKKFEQIDAEFKAAAYEIQELAKERAPKDEGRIANSITVNEAGHMQEEIVCPVSYAPYEEFGTRGKARIPAGLEDMAAQYQGATGRTWQELLRAIVGWVQRKGISGTYSVKTHKRSGSKADRYMQDLEVAYPIARAIAHNGIPPRPFFFPGYLEIKPKLIERLKNILLS